MNLLTSRSLLTSASLLLFGTACIGIDQTLESYLPPPDTVTFVSVSSGDAHACALTDLAEAYCWGANSTGQLGTGTQQYETSPRLVAGVGLTAYFDSISAGGSFSCAITEEFEAYCWGNNSVGQLGIGTNLGYTGMTPQEKVVGGHAFKAIGAGAVHACGLTGDNQVLCWGSPESGRLGNGSAGGTPIPTPDSVLGGLRFRQLDVGPAHSCAITSGGEAYCWGEGIFGEIGDGLGENASEPTLVSGGLRFTSISAGTDHTCGVAIDGVAYCWGSAPAGELGTGELTDSRIPVMVSGGLEFQSISAGGSYTCGVTLNSEAYCWGRNLNGQLGDGTEQDRLVPSAVEGDLTFETVSAGTGLFGTATCGMATDGLVYCWGDGSLGQVGNSDTRSVNVPTRVAGQN